jgi:orotate phosphoribosyltransferase
MGIEETENALNARDQLKEFIKQNGIVFRHVKLSSSKETDYYYDIKKVASLPKGIYLLSKLLLEEIVKHYRPRSVGGLEIGSIPLTTGIMLRSIMNGKYKKGMSGFVIRKNPKTHGLEKKIEGAPEEPIVIVEDVVTSGQSVMDAIIAMRDAGGYSVSGVVCVIDREEEGTVNVLKQNNIKYYSLFNHTEFKSFIEERLKQQQQNQKVQS